MDSLTEQQLASLRHSLTRHRDELKSQLANNRAAAGVVTLDQTSVGRVSRMDAMQQQSMAISTRHKASLTLKKVELALAAMTSGDYGYCRRCEEPIHFERLLAQPEAGLCIDCQSRADQQ